LLIRQENDKTDAKAEARDCEATYEAEAKKLLRLRPKTMKNAKVQT